jgi:hypothetical protein
VLLDDRHIEAIKEAAASIGGYGRITIVFNGTTVDLVEEKRWRFENGVRNGGKKRHKNEEE